MERIKSWLSRTSTSSSSSSMAADETSGATIVIDDGKVTHHGVNIIHNSDLNHGLKGWVPLGSCTLNISTESPEKLPSVESNPINGQYINVSRRTETWMGPSQVLTKKLKPHAAHQVSAWVRVGSSITGLQKIKITLKLNDQWINVAQVDVIDDRWYEIRGSFRLDNDPSSAVTVYVEGPTPGLDLCVTGLRIFACDTNARFEYLKGKTDKVRKRDVILKFNGVEESNLIGSSIRITQSYNSFPFGSCISRSTMADPQLAEFFIKNFNWAVFENELKWYWTEADRSKINYNDSDYLLEFCRKHNKQLRGHCIFWEVEKWVQPWIKSLNNDELKSCVENRLKSLLTRYKGEFIHHDVNNEMLHGSYYKDRLGDDIRAYMFREAQKLDPSAVLFVNDYNILTACDPDSTPEKYIQQILDLQEKGANVGGIGVQGHISNPISETICNSLDTLSKLGLPIWVTELDVEAPNEHVRADDLEVILREAFAHPSVEGIVFWGFSQTFMWKKNAHLVDSDGTVNEAGRRFLSLKQEWLTNIDTKIDRCDEFMFRGFHGGYDVEITLSTGETRNQSFVVEKGESPLVLTVNL